MSIPEQGRGQLGLLGGCQGRPPKQGLCGGARAGTARLCAQHRPRGAVRAFLAQHCGFALGLRLFSYREGEEDPSLPASRTLCSSRGMGHGWPLPRHGGDQKCYIQQLNSSLPP